MEPHHHHPHTLLPAQMPSEETLVKVADLFKIFGDPTRVRIIFVLFHQEECVRDIAQKLEMTQSAISHQLRILKQSRLVTSRREGKTIFYSLHLRPGAGTRAGISPQKKLFPAMEKRLLFEKESAIIEAAGGFPPPLRNADRSSGALPIPQAKAFPERR